MTRTKKTGIHDWLRVFSACLPLFVICLLLTGCGLQPLYAVRDAAGASAALAQVQIANIPDRTGQELRNRLIDRMHRQGRPVDPAYDLTVQLKESRADLGIRTDATSARSQMAMTARYTLTARKDGRTLLSARSSITAGYNKLDAQYANLSSEEDARRRALDDLGEQIVNRLSLYFSAQSSAGAAAHDEP